MRNENWISEYALYFIHPTSSSQSPCNPTVAWSPITHYHQSDIYCIPIGNIDPLKIRGRLPYLSAQVHAWYIKESDITGVLWSHMGFPINLITGSSNGQIGWTLICRPSSVWLPSWWDSHDPGLGSGIYGSSCLESTLFGEKVACFKCHILDSSSASLLWMMLVSVKYSTCWPRALSLT